MNAQRLRAAAAALGLLAGLMLTPVVVDSAAQPPVAAASSDTAAENSSPVTTLQAGLAPRTPGDFPLRRRRIHWNHWSHYVGGGGRFTWLVFGPIVAVALAVLAVPLYLRRRLRRKPTTDPQTISTALDPLTSFRAVQAQQTMPVTADRLKRLEDLHASGTLTDEEFLTQKRRIEGH